MLYKQLKLNQTVKQVSYKVTKTQSEIDQTKRYLAAKDKHQGPVPKSQQYNTKQATTHKSDNNRVVAAQMRTTTE